MVTSNLQSKGEHTEQCHMEYHGKKEAKMSGKVAMWHFPLLYETHKKP